MIVALLHPGQMGAAIGAHLTRHGHTVHWNPHGRSTTTRDRADAAGLHPAPDLPTLLERADLVLSICPAAAAEDVAAEVAAAGFCGMYIDANAVGPHRMREIAATLTDAGATVVDACISGAPPTPEATPRIYLAGPDTAVAETLFSASGFTTTVLGPVIGAASALKMATASWLRTARAQVAISQALADAHGVTAALQREADHFGVPMLADRDYLPSVAARAWRWVPEMGEIADTLADAGLPTDIADATATIYQHLAPGQHRPDLTPEQVLALLHLQSPPHPMVDPVPEN